MRLNKIGYLILENVGAYVDLVRQYDTWEWEANANLTAKRLNDLFFMFSIEEFEEKIINKLAADDSFDFDEVEQTLLKVEESRVDRYIKRKKREVYQVYSWSSCSWCRPC